MTEAACAFAARSPNWRRREGTVMALLTYQRGGVTTRVELLVLEVGGAGSTL